MRKGIPFILFVAYYALGLASLFLQGSYAYYDAGGRSRFVVQHIFVLGLVAVLMGTGFFFLYKNGYAEKFALRVVKRPWLRIVIPLILAVLCFIANIGILFGFNSLTGSGETRRVSGFVTTKLITKGKSRGYFIQVKDTVAGPEYKFEVTAAVYNKTDLLSQFDKQFNVGRLGILYRKKE